LRRSLTLLSFAFVLFFAAGCATRNTAVRDLAERELACPRDAIKLARDEGRVVRATGCGETVRIACHDPNDSTGAAWGWADPLTAGKRVVCERIYDQPRTTGAPAARAAAGSTSAGGRPFDRALAAKLLGASAERARSCGRPDGPRGTARARITFAPDGAVAGVELASPFDDTEVGRCLAAEITRVSLPAFDGEPVRVTKSFEILASDGGS
jgi:hypothetical protein